MIKINIKVKNNKYLKIKEYIIRPVCDGISAEETTPLLLPSVKGIPFWWPRKRTVKLRLPQRGTVTGVVFGVDPAPASAATGTGLYIHPSGGRRMDVAKSAGEHGPLNVYFFFFTTWTCGRGLAQQGS
jgi:hypothetical protein